MSSNSVWVIETEVEQEGYNGTYYEHQIDTDFGYFTDGTDAQDFVDKLTEQNNRSGYDRYVQLETQRHEDKVKLYENDKREREVLKAAGIERKYLGASEPQPLKLITFEQYVKRNGIKYSVVELKAHSK